MTTKLTKPTHAVVWLDRRDAQIIWFDPGHVDVQRIHSRSHHKSNGGHAGTHQLKHGREVHGNHSSGGGHDTHDEQYYHEVAQALGSAVEILVKGRLRPKTSSRPIASATTRWWVPASCKCCPATTPMTQSWC